VFSALESQSMSEVRTLALGDPVLGEGEKQALCAVIDGGWLTMGDRVAAFERPFAELHGVKDAVAVNSCTAGLHLCLRAINIGPGDQVLVPSLTFVATVNAVLHVGATPIFVDIEKEDMPHISLRDADAKCTPRTKGAIVMHYAGYPVDLRAWRSFADARGLTLMEDAAHAPAVGEVRRWGNASAFSFFTNKNMTTAEGGMVLARDASILEQVRSLRAHGMTSSTVDRDRGHAYSYDVTTLGYNYRLDELRAAIGLTQLQHLQHWNARRRELTALYIETLDRHAPEVFLPFTCPKETAALLMPVLLPPGVHRETVMSALRCRGIQSSIHYPPVHQFSYYRARFPAPALPHTEEFCSRELSLPLHPALTDQDVERIATTLGDEVHKVCTL
jgi:dTDP-4-amino-4,6-dideoxygalactose transaminase